MNFPLAAAHFMHSESRSIILKRIAYREADWIVTFFSRSEGRLSGIARSARSSLRRFGGALEPGTIVSLSLTDARGGGTLVNLTEARVEISPVGIMKTLERISAMGRALELALAFLQEHQKAEDKFDLLESRLKFLSCNNPAVCDSLKFEIEWLKLAGYEPHLGNCVRCGTGQKGDQGWSFDYDQGGVICGRCSMAGKASKVQISKQAALTLCELDMGNNVQEGALAGEIERLFSNYVDFVAGRPVRKTNLCAS